MVDARAGMGNRGSASEADSTGTPCSRVAEALAISRAFGGPTVPAPQVPGYRLRRELGRGAQGTVWLAEHLTTGREVAVKVAATRTAFTDPVDRERFRREVRILARLQHPHLVAVFDSGTTACGRAFFVMDRVRGERLDAFALGCGRDARTLAAVFARIAAAVHRAHQAGVVHRDLKPGNLMVDPDGAPRVLDFGLAQDGASAVPPRSDVAAAGADSERGFVGTPAWTSPEQASPGGQAETRSDVHALGAVLYDALCGVPPFLSGADLGDTLAAIRTAPPRPLRDLRPDLDPEISAIVAHCLQKLPEQRYGSCAELAAELERYRAGLPLSILAHRRGYRLRKFVARHRLGTALTALAAGAIVVSGAVAAWSWRQTERERDQLRRRNAANQVLLAAHAIEDDLVGRASELLAECPLDLRDWEWRWLQGQTDRCVRRVDLGAPLYAVAASADGTRVAVGGRGGAIAIVEPRTGELLRTWSPLAGDVRALEWSPDGRRLCAVASNGQWSGWRIDDANGATAPTVVEVGAAARNLTLHPGGDLCAVAGDDGVVELLSWSEGRIRAEHRCGDAGTGWARGLCWRPDGSELVVADGAALVCLRSEDLEVVRRLPARADIGSLHFLGDGRRLVAGTTDGHLLLLGPDGRELEHREPHGNWIYRVAVGPDQNTLLSAGSDHTVKLWDAETLTLRATLRGHTARVFDAAFVGQLGHLATAGEDGTLRLWAPDTVDGARQFAGHSGQIWGLAWSPDGDRVATAGADGSVRVQPVGGRRIEPVVARDRAPLHAATFADRSHVAVGNHAGEVASLDATDGRELWRTPATAPRIVGLGLTAGGSRIVAVGSRGDRAILDATTGSVLARRPARAATLSLAVSPDGATLLLGRANGQVVVERVDDGAELAVLQAHDRRVFGLCWDATGRRFCTASTDATARVYDAATFACTAVLRGHRNGVRTVCFHPGGTRIATGGWDGTVRLWDAGSGELVLTLRDHDGRVEGVAFDPQGRRLGAVGLDGTLRVWDER